MFCSIIASIQFILRCCYDVQVIYKLLLLDIDGTLTESKGHALPSKAVRDAVQRAQARVQVAVATGRPYSFAQPVVEALGLKGLGIFNGGAEIVDMASTKVVQRWLLEIETLKELVGLALPFGYDVFTDTNQYSKPLRTPDDIVEPAAKLFMQAVNKEDALHVLEQLNGVPAAAAHSTTSWDDGDVVDIHITHVDATKRHGAERLANMLGVRYEEIIGVGDGHNDVPLLEAVGLKVAMGNAPDELKPIADYVAPKLSEDGVADVIQRYILRD